MLEQRDLAYIQLKTRQGNFRSVRKELVFNKTIFQSIDNNKKIHFY